MKETNANLLVQQYGLFIMKEDEKVETMFLRCQVLVSRLISIPLLSISHIPFLLCLPLDQIGSVATTTCQSLRHLGICSIHHGEWSFLSSRVMVV